MARRSLLARLLVPLALFGAGCIGSASDEAEVSDTATIDPTGCASPDLLCVGLVLAPGEPSNSAGVRGVEAAIDASSGHGEIVRTDDFGDYRVSLESLADQDFDLIFARTGPDVASAERAVLGVANGSESAFVFIGRLETDAPNVASLTFDERRAAFLAGAVAGLITESGVVGAVLATDLDPATVRYKEGWEAGARFTNPQVELVTSYHPGALDISFVDPPWSVEAARRILESEADVVFGAGGLSGKAAVVEVAAAGGQAHCIGVESDHWDTVIEARPCLATSALLMIDAAVADIVETHLEGEPPSGTIEGRVGLAPFRDDAMAADLEPALAEITAGLDDGSIRTR